ncbi:MAG: hypothetical protein ACJAVT_001674 [Yoonia sp.]|jgi:hypothetical protein
MLSASFIATKPSQNADAQGCPKLHFNFLRLILPYCVVQRSSGNNYANSFGYCYAVLANTVFGDHRRSKAARLKPESGDSQLV